MLVQLVKIISNIFYSPYRIFCVSSLNYKMLKKVPIVLNRLKSRRKHIVRDPRQFYQTYLK